MKMKYSGLLLIFISPCILAEQTDDSVNKTCLKHAISVTDQLRSEILSDLDKEQLNRILRITSEDCKKFFAAAPQKVSDKQAMKEDIDESEEESGDWFTEKIFSGDTTRKDGNKRLDRLRRK